jgi:hypothetical protein
MLAFLDPEWIRAAAPGEFWTIAGIAWALSLAGLIGAFYFFRRLQYLEDTPQSLIRSAAQGYVELQGSGRLMPGEPIVAPLTQNRCLWWSYRVEQKVSSGRRTTWETVERDVSREMFFIQDATGQCVIDPEKADVYPSVTQTWYGNTPQPEGGPALGTLGIGSRYRYVEERMQDGDPLYALGYFHTQGPLSSADIDEDVRQLLVKWKRDQAWLIQHFDQDHDGQLDTQEWEAARQEARRLVLEQDRDAMTRPPMNMLTRPPDDRPYILSTLPQKNLELRMRLYVAAGLLLLLLAGAAGTQMLTVRLSVTSAGSHAGP